MSLKVLFIENSRYKQREFLDEMRSQYSGIEFAAADEPSSQVAQIRDADVVYGGIPLREVFLAAESLKWIQYPGAGFDRILQVPELVTGDVVVTNSRGTYEKVIADHVFALTLGLSVRRQNKWDRMGAFKACNLDANGLRQFSDLPTSVRLDSFASPPVSSPVWRLGVRGTYPPA